MKRYIPYILAFLALSCIVSCATNDEIANPADGGHMTLRLVSSTMTRAEGDLDNSRNEDKLVTADLYFYSADAQGNAKWHHHIDFTDTYDSATVNDINLSAEVMNQVFGTGTEGQLYVIANYSGATALPTTANIGESGIPNSSIAELQKYSLTTSFGPASSNATWADQTSFVMDGQGKIEKNGSDVAGTISLTRAAAKIELSISGFVEEAVKDANGNEWTPNFKDDDSIEAYVKLINGVGSSYVGGSELLKPYTYDKTTATDGYYGFNAPTAGTTIYPQKNPFYSYSSDWSANGEANKASLLLVVPWKRKSDGNVDNCYYEIPIGSRDNVTIDRNKYYQISIFVGTLGSFEESENVELTPNITVVDWSTGSIEADINEARYLVVDETEIEIFNATQCNISYASSHPATAKIDSIVFNSYKLANTRKIKITSTSKTITPAANNLSIADVYADYDLSYGTTTERQTLNNLPKGNASVGFTHAIPTYYVPRTIYVTVQHTDNAQYSQQVKIVQYPPIYFVGEVATGHVYVNTKYTSSGTSISVSDDNGNDIGSVRNPSTVTGDDGETNNNVNNYDIYVTVLPSDSKWQIGDPRETTGSALSGINELSNYRKTRTDAVNVIAPAFKIASSRGKTTDVNFNNATKRCASYQENGFPAGRWRVPTPAEIEFIVTRSASNDIPSLFNGAYWAGNGQYFDSDDLKLHTSNSKNYVRCVYDIWYWGDDKIEGALNKSVWGDVKDNATLNSENPVN